MAVTSLQDDVLRSASASWATSSKSRPASVRTDSLKPSEDRRHRREAHHGRATATELFDEAGRGIEETAMRLTNYVVRVVTLIAFVDEKQTASRSRARCWTRGSKAEDHAERRGRARSMSSSTPPARRRRKGRGAGAKMHHTRRLRTASAKPSAVTSRLPPASRSRRPSRRLLCEEGRRAAMAMAMARSRRTTRPQQRPGWQSGQGPLADPTPTAKSEKPCDLVVENANGSTP